MAKKVKKVVGVDDGDDLIIDQPIKKATPLKVEEDDDNDAWFSVGESGLKKKRQLEKSAELRREKAVPRFFLKTGESATIVFLDSVGFFCLVHQLNIGGNWRNFLTCVRDFKPCPVCEYTREFGNSKEKGSLVYCGHYTIISLQQYVNSAGETVKYFKALFPAKKQMIDKVAELANRYKDKGGLTGLACKVTRYEGEPNCGGTIEVIKRVDVVKQFPDIKDFKPYDYKKVLAPPTQEELEALGFGSSFIAGSIADIKGETLDELI